MTEYDYLSSLKNKEFLFLRKLCDNSISQTKKEKLQEEQKGIRSEIKKLE